MTHRFDAVVVGAGFGGIGAAIELKRLGYDDVLIVDREDGLGGTWHVNRYPGLAVDVPSTTYSYSFEPNPYWSRLYAPGAELKRYAEHVADRYDVRRHMRFNTNVEGARWDEDAQVWQVALAGNGAGNETLSTRFLIVATGFLSQPRTPSIPGIDSFGGPVIHAAHWNDRRSFSGRRVGIIGTGSTGVQLIPELGKHASELTVYQRTPIWVLPKLDVRFPAAVQRLFARIPPLQRIVRWITDTTMDLAMLLAMWKYRRFKGINKAASALAKAVQFASIRDKELRRKLTPDYDYGCKRPTVSNSYYRTFARSHVHLEASGIERIEHDGVVACDGGKRYIDDLILATGFDVWDVNLPAIEVIGREGRNLGKWWRDNRFQAYQGVSVPYFPNFLTMASPYAWVGLSWFHTVEYQMRHMDRLFSELQRRDARTFEVTEAANSRFLDRMTETLGDSVFYLGNCATSRSYWFNHSGEAPLFRPTSVRAAIKEQERFPLSDYAMS